MRIDIDLTMTKEERAALLQRAGPLLVVIIIHILGVIGLMTLAPEYNPFKKPDNDLKLIDLQPPPPPEKAKAKEIVSRPKAGGAPRKAPEPAGPPPPLNMTIMDSRTFAQTDIGAIRSGTPGGPVVAANNGTPDGDGNGLPGAQIFGVDWYREPTNAELETYFQKALGNLRKNGMNRGWGTVACKTAPRYRVEDCHEIDEYPAHSGFSRAVREASWQFQVVPRRVGNKAMLGEWVFVTIDFTLDGAKLAGDDSRHDIDPAKIRAFQASLARSSGSSQGPSTPRVYGPPRP